MHAEAIWLPTTGKRTVVVTDGRRCKGDFLQTIFADFNFYTNCSQFPVTRTWKINNKSVKRAPFTSVSCFRLCYSATFLA